MKSFKNITLFVILFAPLTALPMKRPGKTTDDRESKRKRIETTINLAITDNTTQHVTLTTNDGKTIIIDLSTAQKSVTLKNMIEDIGTTDTPIPLHNISSSTITTIITLLQHLPNDVDITEQERAKLITNLTQLKSQELFDLINAINFLDIKVLLDSSLEQWADRCTSTFDLFKNKTDKHIACDNQFMLPEDLSTIMAHTIDAKLGISPWLLQNFNFCKDIYISFGHPPLALCYSPDGTTLISGEYNGFIKFWQLDSTTNTWICRSTLQDHYTPIRALCYSPDGTTLVSGGDNGFIKFWKFDPVTNTWVCKHTLQGHNTYINALCYSPDGTTLASCSNDGTIKLWQFDHAINTWSCKKTLDDCKDFICFNKALSYSPNGITFVSSTYGDSIKIWEFDLATNTRVFNEHTLQCYKDAFAILHYKSDDTTLTSCSDDGSIKIWQFDRAINTWICKYTLEGHRDWPIALCYSPDGTTLASCSGDNTIKIWDLALYKDAVLQIEKLNLKQMLLLSLIHQSKEEKKEKLTIAHNQVLIDIFNSLPDEVKKVLEPHVILNLPPQSSWFDSCLIQ